MKNSLIFIFMLFSISVKSQLAVTRHAMSQGDSIRKKKPNGVWYVSPMVGLYTGTGTISQRTTIDIEIGREWDVLSLGLDIGKNHIGQRSGKDTTTYFEARPSLNVFQQGPFTNTLTIGLGYIVNAQQNILTEITTGIEYTASEHISYNVFFGTYYYSGSKSSSQQNFFGISVMYFFDEQKIRGLFNPHKN